MRAPHDPRTGAVRAVTGDAGGGSGGEAGREAGGGEGRGAGYRLERRYRFSASHLYRRPEWTDEENRTRFGKCANLPGHGHNYRLFVTVRGPLDPETAFVADLGRLDDLVARLVVDRLDHQHVNAALPEFAAGGLNPSSEALVRWIREQLVPELPPELALVRLRLEEDEDLAAEWHLADG
jgi:6-pyruvoyltetrahydropterin/6-carboxytetrahydropterin synthase